MADQLEIRAEYRGGYRADVTARHHRIVIDEPASAGGGDKGMMPTEALWASLASCFCLALGFVAGKRDLDLPGLVVTCAPSARGPSCATAAWWSRPPPTSRTSSSRADATGAARVLGVQHAGRRDGVRVPIHH